MRVDRTIRFIRATHRLDLKPHFVARNALLLKKRRVFLDTG